MGASTTRSQVQSKEKEAALHVSIRQIQTPADATVEEAHTSLGKWRKALKDLNEVITQTNHRLRKSSDGKTKSLHQNKGKASYTFAQFLLFPRCPSVK